MWRARHAQRCCFPSVFSAGLAIKLDADRNVHSSVTGMLLAPKASGPAWQKLYVTEHLTQGLLRQPEVLSSFAAAARSQLTWHMCSSADQAAWESRGVTQPRPGMRCRQPEGLRPGQGRPQEAGAQRLPGACAQGQGRRALDVPQRGGREVVPAPAAVDAQGAARAHPGERQCMAV